MGMTAVTSKKTVRLGNVALGDGTPGICVPVMGGTIGEIGRAAQNAARAGADLIELRIDSLSAAPKPDEAIEACRAAKEASGLPVIFTLRTARDGGPGTADAQVYEALLCCVAKEKICDAVDCELSVGDAAFERIVSAAHASGVFVVGSSHEFGEIGDMERAKDWMLRQQTLGADICKAAVMVRSPAQAFEAARVFAGTYEQLHQPMIAIAMGGYGAFTRFCCRTIGSCLTFGTAGEASAPGQMEAGALRCALKLEEKALRGSASNTI